MKSTPQTPMPYADSTAPVHTQTVTAFTDAMALGVRVPIVLVGATVVAARTRDTYNQ